MTQSRRYWIDTMLAIAEPVIAALAEGRLKRDMPVEAPPELDRTHCTYLEALGRTIDGVAPWLACEGFAAAPSRRRSTPPRPISAT